MSSASTTCGWPFCDPGTFVANHDSFLENIVLNPELGDWFLNTLGLPLLLQESGTADKAQVKDDIRRAIEKKDDFLTGSKGRETPAVRRLVEDD